MKVRTGFVSNSSSSSFLIVTKKDADEVKSLEEWIDRWFLGDLYDEECESIKENTPIVVLYERLKEDLIEEIQDKIEDGTPIENMKDVERYTSEYHDANHDDYNLLSHVINCGYKARVVSFPDGGDGGSKLSSALRYMGRSLECGFDGWTVKRFD
jgi:hypothetical protein